MNDSPSWGKILQHTLQENLRAFQRGFTGSTRVRPIIWDVTADGTFVNGNDLDTFLARATDIVRESGRVYAFENTIVFEFRKPPNQRLTILGTGDGPMRHAASILANLFVVAVLTETGPKQTVVPTKLAGALLVDEDLGQAIPRIRTYSPRALFDENFDLRGPGWHAEQGLLIHGTEIVAALLGPVPHTVRSLDRLPPYLRRLLQDFCWASDADLENALALLLTGVLCNHFVTNPKPVGLVDGNQQEIGKTLLCQVIGQVLDGQNPEPIPLVKDEDLEKKISAKLRASKSSVFFFDNVKAKLDSAWIEANSPSPLISARILGHSRDIIRPNTYLWLFTSNLSTGSSDLISRGIPVRLRYEGNPVERHFSENLLEYATRRRLAILGELAGMVLRWISNDKPAAKDVWPASRPVPRHRCDQWAGLIGGILGSNGFFNFLSNVEEARAAMDEGLQALATVAEYLLTKSQGGISKSLDGSVNPPATDPNRGKLPGEWAQVFAAADVFRDKLTGKNARGRETLLGTFLSGKTDRAVSITIGTNNYTAILRRNPVRSDQKRYYLEVTASSPTSPAELGPAPPESGPAAVMDQPDVAVDGHQHDMDGDQGDGNGDPGDGDGDHSPAVTSDIPPVPATQPPDLGGTTGVGPDEAGRAGVPGCEETGNELEWS